MRARNILAVSAVTALLMQMCATSWAAEPGHAGEIARAQFSHELPDTRGASLTTVIVELAPGATAAPHRHGGAFVYAYVLEGTVRSQLDGAPARTYRTGEDWFEQPNAHHVLTQNPSPTSPARLLVVFVAPTGAPLKLVDPS